MVESTINNSLLFFKTTGKEKKRNIACNSKLEVVCSGKL